MSVSVIIATRDRCQDLALTLEALRGVHVPAALPVEVVVVDNGSRDQTAEVVRLCRLPGWAVRLVREEIPGKSRALNRGLAASTGDIVLITDDDARPPANWIEGMRAPLFERKADVVAGGVRLAPALVRPWMTPLHRSWLACTERFKGEAVGLVGANMGFSRQVLDRVPGFDVELGPGRAGFGEDDLFALQLLAAGYRIRKELSIEVEHHFPADRLRRAPLLELARKLGESHAIIGHHWYHWPCRLGPLRLLAAQLSLRAWRARHRRRLQEEGCPEEELVLAFRAAMIERHLRERNRPRRYARLGAA